MNNLHVKTGDNVMVISGKCKGKTGKVLQTSPKEGKVIVEGLNMVTKHVKPRRQGEQGGIVKAEGAIYACKVMPVCPKCGKAPAWAILSRTARPSAFAASAALNCKGGVHNGTFARTVCQRDRSGPEQEVRLQERYADPQAG